MSLGAAAAHEPRWRPQRLPRALRCVPGAAVIGILAALAVGLGRGNHTSGNAPAPAERTGGSLATVAGGDPAGGRQAGSACNDLLGFDRVALLFITVGGLRHEQLWRRWFESARSVVPLHAVQASGCSKQELRDECRAPASGGVLAAQLLFSVYVHSRPDHSFGADSLFFGRKIAKCVLARWATADLVIAQRRLLKAALQEPRNARFLMASDSCVPLYPPATVHAALLGEPRSRVAACRPTWEDNFPGQQRSWTLNGGAAPPLTQAHFRKSSQWTALIRPHAELLANDTAVFPALSADYPGSPLIGAIDEVYPATLLAYCGLDGETDCAGYATSVEFLPHTEHPTSYPAADVSADLVDKLRTTRLEVFTIEVEPSPGDAPCQPQAAMRAAAAGYTTVRALTKAGSCRAVARAKAGMRLWQPELLGRLCPLLARKFENGTEAVVIQVLEAAGVLA